MSAALGCPVMMSSIMLCVLVEESFSCRGLIVLEAVHSVPYHIFPSWKAESFSVWLLDAYEVSALGFFPKVLQACLKAVSYRLVEDIWRTARAFPVLKKHLVSGDILHFVVMLQPLFLIKCNHHLQLSHFPVGVSNYKSVASCEEPQALVH